MNTTSSLEIHRCAWGLRKVEYFPISVSVTGILRAGERRWIYCWGKEMKGRLTYLISRPIKSSSKAFDKKTHIYLWIATIWLIYTINFIIISHFYIVYTKWSSTSKPLKKNILTFIRMVEHESFKDWTNSSGKNIISHWLKKKIGWTVRSTLYWGKAKKKVVMSISYFWRRQCG